MKTTLPLAVLTIVSTTAPSLLASGCTWGVVVDSNFNQTPVSGTITFHGLDANLNPTGTAFTTFLDNDSVVSWDPYAPQGATVGGGAPNQQEGIAAGNYWVEYMTPGWPPAKIYESNNFVHSYQGGCTDKYTQESDQHCQPYFFQLREDCTPCFTTSWNGTKCPQTPPDLPTENGIKVIQICLIK
jgi:hypothetical protein